MGSSLREMILLRRAGAAVRRAAGADCKGQLKQGAEPRLGVGPAHSTEEPTVLDAAQVELYSSH
jgi:hypothetical protein